MLRRAGGLLCLTRRIVQRPAVLPVMKRTEQKKKIMQHRSLVIAWLHTSYCRTESGSVAKRDVFVHYLEMCKANRIRPSSAAAFGKVVRLAFPSIKCNRVGPRGASKHHYRQLGLRNGNYNLSLANLKLDPTNLSPSLGIKLDTNLDELAAAATAASPSSYDPEFCDDPDDPDDDQEDDPEEDIDSYSHQHQHPSQQYHLPPQHLQHQHLREADQAQETNNKGLLKFEPSLSSPDEPSRTIASPSASSITSEQHPPGARSMHRNSHLGNSVNSGHITGQPQSYMPPPPQQWKSIFQTNFAPPFATPPPPLPPPSHHTHNSLPPNNNSNIAPNFSKLASQQSPHQLSPLPVLLPPPSPHQLLPHPHPSSLENKKTESFSWTSPDYPYHMASQQHHHHYHHHAPTPSVGFREWKEKEELSEYCDRNFQSLYETLCKQSNCSEEVLSIVYAHWQRQKQFSRNQSSMAAFPEESYNNSQYTNLPTISKIDYDNRMVGNMGTNMANSKDTSVNGHSPQNISEAFGYPKRTEFERDNNRSNNNNHNGATTNEDNNSNSHNNMYQKAHPTTNHSTININSSMQHQQPSNTNTTNASMHQFKIPALPPTPLSLSWGSSSFSFPSGPDGNLDINSRQHVFE